MKTLGPMPIYFATKLQQMLEEQGRSAEIVPAEQEVRAYHEKTGGETSPELGREVHLYPKTETWSDMALLRMREEDFEIVREEVAKMDVAPAEPIATPPTAEEYFCPKCDYKADAPKLCPQHGLTLLEYSEWVKHRGKAKWAVTLVWIFVVLIALGIAVNLSDVIREMATKA